MLPDGCFIEQLKDSKKVAPSVREKLFEVIQTEATDYGIGMVMPEEIDRINILNATKKAMLQAISRMKSPPDYLIIDAVELPIEIEQLSMFKADSLSISVAAASILAKVTRDRWMVQANERYPGYGFAQHKGYGTEEHLKAIRKNGLCPYTEEPLPGSGWMSPYENIRSCFTAIPSSSYPGFQKMACLWRQVYRLILAITDGVC